MATTDTTTLAVETREPGHSRETRRLRRSGRVPGVVYGGDGGAIPFAVDARELRHALAAGGAVIELAVEGKSTPVVVKEQQRHPVTGSIMHIDLLRVRLDRTIHAMTVVELVGSEESPGVKEGGVLEQVTREINVEALPTSLPETIELDVSHVDIGDTITLASLKAPEGVTLLDDPDETVLVTCSPPRLELEPEVDLEEEIELIGEDGEPIERPEGEDEGDDDGGGGEPAADGDGE
jgi:large subunit ribosomal protein L25